MNKSAIHVFFLTLFVFDIFPQSANWKLFSLEELIGINNTITRDIVEDSHGNKWFGTSKGLIKFDNNLWYLYDQSNSPLKEDDIWVLHFDSNENLWVGTLGNKTGLAKLHNDEWTIYTLGSVGILGTSVFAIESDLNDNLWMGTYWDGLVKFDKDTSWLIYNSNNSGILQPQEEINCITIDDSNKIWYGSDAWGGGVFDQKSSWQLFTPGNSPIDFAIYSLHILNSGEVWFGGVYFISIRNVSGSWDTLSCQNARWYSKIVQDDDSTIFVASSLGLLEYNLNSKIFLPLYPSNYSFLDSLGCWGLMKDSNGNIWIGYYNGYIGLYNKNGIVNIDEKFDNIHLNNYLLAQNFPNPFNPLTKISYQIKEDGFVTLKLYDILGAEIKTLIDEVKTKGRYMYEFNGNYLASGMYIYQLKVNDFFSSKKLLLIK